MKILIYIEYIDIFNYFQKTDVEAKQLWIYAALLMSVGPVGPGGGVYSIVEVVVSNQSNNMAVVKKNLRSNSCPLQNCKILQLSALKL